MKGGLDMKTVCKNMFKLCAFLLLAAGAAQTATAQKPVVKPKHHYYNTIQAIRPGDSIYVHPDSLYYLTGERVSKWVYKVPHQVQQVGGRRYPMGVLIKGIYSWVYPYTLVPIEIEDPCMALPEGFVSTVLHDTVCGEYLWNATNQIYTTTGEYTFKDTTIHGCDSIVTLHLVVNQPSMSDTTITIYEDGLPYTWNGIVMTAAGDTSALVGRNVAGCDSIQTLHLIVEPIPVVAVDSTKLVRTKIAFNPYEDEGKLGWTHDIPYETNRFGLGVRGGFASHMAGEKGIPLGFDALLDLHYAHYWIKSDDKCALGITTGLNIGYVHARQWTTVDETFTASTVDGDVDYQISVDKVSEKTHMLQLEIPVMFSLTTPSRFFFNVGPKLILPVYTNYNQKLDNPLISAFLPELNGNPITNEVVMGKVPDAQLDYSDKLIDNPCKLMSLALGAELGYNFKLKKGGSYTGNTLDLGIYVDYSVYSLYRNSIHTGKIISLTPPTNEAPADVKVQTITNAFADKLGFLDAGLKITYNFDSHYYYGYR